MWPATSVFPDQVLRGLVDLWVQEATHRGDPRTLVIEGHLAAGRLQNLLRKCRIPNGEGVHVILPGKNAHLLYNASTFPELFRYVWIVPWNKECPHPSRADYKQFSSYVKQQYLPIITSEKNDPVYMSQKTSNLLSNFLLSSLNALILLTWPNQCLPLILLGQFHEDIRSFRLIVKSSIKNSMFLTHVNGVNDTCIGI